MAAKSYNCRVPINGYVDLNILASSDKNAEAIARLMVSHMKVEEITTSLDDKGVINDIQVNVV